jgi:large subunit ribosomal protein L5
MARLYERYKNEIVPKLMEQFGIKNRLAVPRLQKITVNMGIGKAVENPKRVEDAAKSLGLIAGQKPLVTKSKKAISGFKLRQGIAIGCKVTLRGKRMYEFLDRLVNVAIPRIRDFRGVPKTAFDKGGNYSLGIAEQTIFPEISPDQVEFPQGMDVTLTISNGSLDRSHALLQQFGLPFRA